MLVTDTYVSVELKVQNIGPVVAWVTENIPVEFHPTLTSRYKTTGDILVRATFPKHGLDHNKVEHFATLFRLFWNEK